jgi:multiple sugar transport system substrate-binding protein
MGTDTRGLWYNKNLLAKAGIKLPWQPKTWADVVRAAAAVKKADPGVIPINIYSGVAPVLRITENVASRSLRM